MAKPMETHNDSWVLLGIISRSKVDLDLVSKQAGTMLTKPQV